MNKPAKAVSERPVPPPPPAPPTLDLLFFFLFSRSSSSKFILFLAVPPDESGTKSPPRDEVESFTGGAACTGTGAGGCATACFLGAPSRRAATSLHLKHVTTTWFLSFPLFLLHTRIRQVKDGSSIAEHTEHIFSLICTGIATLFLLAMRTSCISKFCDTEGCPAKAMLSAENHKYCICCVTAPGSALPVTSCVTCITREWPSETPAQCVDQCNAPLFRGRLLSPTVLVRYRLKTYQWVNCENLLL